MTVTRADDSSRAGALSRTGAALGRGLSSVMGAPGRVDVSAHAREKIYAHLDVSVSCAAGCAPIDDFVWEHERKESRGTWTSHAKHRRPRDPRRFSSLDYGYQGESVEAVAPRVPEKFVVDRNWCADGWRYAVAFPEHAADKEKRRGSEDTAFKWSKCETGGARVRRRAWKRELVHETRRHDTDARATESSADERSQRHLRIVYEHSPQSPQSPQARARAEVARIMAEAEDSCTKRSRIETPVASSPTARHYQRARERSDEVKAERRDASRAHERECDVRDQDAARRARERRDSKSPDDEMG